MLLVAQAAYEVTVEVATIELVLVVTVETVSVIVVMLVVVAVPLIVVKTSGAIVEVNVWVDVTVVVTGGTDTVDVVV